MTQPPPIPFPDFPPTTQGQTAPAGTAAAPSPAVASKARKAVARLPLAVPGARQVGPHGAG